MPLIKSKIIKMYSCPDDVKFISRSPKKKLFLDLIQIICAHKKLIFTYSYNFFLQLYVYRF